MDDPRSRSATYPWLLRFTAVALGGWVAASGFSIVAAQAFGLLAALGWVATLCRERRRPSLPLLAPWLAYLGVSVAAALASPDPVAGLLGLRADWLPFVLFYACVNDPGGERSAWRLARVLVVAGVVMALAGMLQVALRGTAFRASGTLGHYMTYSGVLLVALVLAAAALLAGERRTRAWAAVAAAPMLAALLLGQTRGAWIGLLAGLALLAALRDRRLLLVLPLLAAGMVLAAPAQVRARVVALVRLEDVTATERLYMWRAGARIVAAHPFRGAGPDQLPEAYAGSRLPDDPSPAARPFSHLHSNPVQIAAERGVPVLLAWCWLYLAFARDAWRMLRRTGAGTRARCLVAGGLAALVAFHVAGLTEYNHGDTEVLYVATLALSLPYLATAPGTRDDAPGDGAR